MLNMYVLMGMCIFVCFYIYKLLYIQAKMRLCEKGIVLSNYWKNKPIELHSCFFLYECIFLNEINKIILCFSY